MVLCSPLRKTSRFAALAGAQARPNYTSYRGSRGYRAPEMILQARRVIVLFMYWFSAFEVIGQQ